MCKKKFLSIIIFISIFSFSLLLSDTIIVDINGGGDYTIIQEGINASIDGDTVLVYPGTYYENINYNGKNITVTSLYLTTQNNSYIDSTIIDGNQNGSVVNFESGEDSSAVLFGFTIQNGSGTYDLHNIRGGGIFCKNSEPIINSCIIKNNNAEIGAGIHCRYADITLENTTICHNHAFLIGGGIHVRDNSTINFSTSERCNIYYNYSGMGCDIETYQVQELNVIVDTFTVMEPDSYFALSQPENNFTFDILHAMIEPINQDLYVSPDGDNNNSGFTPEDPLKNIAFALTKIASDSTHPNVIHLVNGIYSPLLTDEKFPLNCRNYVSVIGEYEDNTILNAESISNIFVVYDDNNFYIENLTIQNGMTSNGGGIFFFTDSSPTIKNVSIKNNTANGGGAVLCYNNCSPIFENVTIQENSAYGGVIDCTSNSTPVFINCTIKNNVATEAAGGGIIYLSGISNPVLINVEISGNHADDLLMGHGGGIATSTNATPYLINVTICDNSANLGGGIYCSKGLNITNSIFYNNSPEQIYATSTNIDTIEVSYSNFQDGEEGIQLGGNMQINWLEGNIDSIPQFVAGEPFSYQLTEGSPCIDAGNPDTTGLNLPELDLAGNPRIVGDTIDMGAYEWQDTSQVVDEEHEFYKDLYLFQNKPNPFSTSTTITFISADYERIKDYKLSIYNVKGQLIKTYDGKRDNFWVKTDIVWDGSDEEGRKVTPGVYFYKLSYGNNSVARKMLLVK